MKQIEGHLEIFEDLKLYLIYFLSSIAVVKCSGNDKELFFAGHSVSDSSAVYPKQVTRPRQLLGRETPKNQVVCRLQIIYKRSK
jgi:hypothetical protein